MYQMFDYKGMYLETASGKWNPLLGNLLFGGRKFKTKKLAESEWYDTFPGRNDRMVVVRCVALLVVILGAMTAQAQELKYWTKTRIAETAGVTVLHAVDAAQTCWHMENTKGWQEYNPMTPHNCAGAATGLVGSGVLIQWATYEMVRRHPNSRMWNVVDHASRHIQIAVSIDALRCSSRSGGCKSGY